MAGSYRTLDRVARSLVDDAAPPADECLRDLEDRFRKYEARYSAEKKQMRETIKHLTERNAWYEAALRQLQADLAACRQSRRKAS